MCSALSADHGDAATAGRCARCELEMGVDSVPELCKCFDL